MGIPAGNLCGPGPMISPKATWQRQWQMQKAMENGTGNGKWQKQMAMSNGRIFVVNEVLDVGELQEAKGPIVWMCEVISQ